MEVLLGGLETASMTTFSLRSASDIVSCIVKHKNIISDVLLETDLKVRDLTSFPASALGLCFLIILFRFMDHCYYLARSASILLAEASNAISDRLSRRVGMDRIIFVLNSVCSLVLQLIISQQNYLHARTPMRRYLFDIARVEVT